MNQLRSDEDLATMLSGKRAALFVFVDWSEYARRGLDVFKEAESKLTPKSSTGDIVWWLADISSTESSVSVALHQWLKLQEQQGKVRIFPGVALGNGAVVWIKSGNIVELEPSAERSGVETLIQRAEEVLAAS